MKRGYTLIKEERLRQTKEEGWDAAHDDDHSKDELAWAAVCYAAPDNVYVMRQGSGGIGHVVFADPWPWSSQWDKRPTTFDRKGYRRREPTPEERLRCLVKAGALIAAEIDRLQREGAANGQEGP